MNEISDPRDNRDQALASVAERHPEVIPPRGFVMSTSPMRASSDFDELYAAIGHAQAHMPAIKKNRKVTVRPKERPEYTYRYATLDKINEALIPALNAAGLVFIQPPVTVTGGRTVILGRLVHPASKQWLEVEMAYQVNANPQATGSAMTYSRRYQTVSLFNLSADEDDDLNQALGYDVSYDQGSSKKSTMPHVESSTAETILRQLEKMCVKATERDPTDADDIIGYWGRLAGDLEPLRKRNPPAWLWMGTTVKEALIKTVNQDLAVMWSSATAATDEKNWNVVEAKIMGKWSGSLAKLATELPDTHKRLMQHFEQQRARIAALTRAAAPKAAPAPAAEQQAAADPAPTALSIAPAQAAQEEPPPAFGEEAYADPVEVSAPPPADPAPHDINAFSRHLVDEFGEVASDPYQDQVAFMRAYLAMKETLSDPTDIENFGGFNNDAVAEAWQDPRARSIFEGKVDGPAPEPEKAAAPAPVARLRIDPPRAANGLIALHPFTMSAIKLIAQLPPADIDPWLLTNKVVFDEVPETTQNRLMSAINKRCVELGLDKRDRP